jgi:opacity protein-like surface antigen
MKNNRSSRVLIVVVALASALAGATQAAVVVSLPTGTLEADSVTRAYAVSVAGGAGKPITGYDLFFSGTSWRDANERDEGPT